MGNSPIRHGHNDGAETSNSRSSDKMATLPWESLIVSRRRLFALGAAGFSTVLAACGSSSKKVAITSPPAAATSTTGAVSATSAATAAGPTAAGTTTAGATTAPVANTAGPVATITGGGGGDGTIKIGWVSPSTGALAPFAAADDFIISAITTFLAPGLIVGGKSYKVQILREDSESVSDTAAAKALKLINNDKIDLMLVGNTPDNANPVSDQCEANGVPCISSLAPWQPWFIGRGGTPGKESFQWTYHFFWGLEDVIAAFVAMWDKLDTDKQVGGLFPNDPDGNAWGDATNGFAKPLKTAGYDLTDPGRYEDGNQDFTAQLTAFKTAKTDIITGVVIPPDFPTFWKQAKQQGFTPKAASIGKALLFPESIKALGDVGIGLSSEVWWSPSHPYSSSLTGQSAKVLTDAYTKATGNQWTQPIGFAHALLEVALAALVKAGSTDKAAIRDAVKGMKLNTIVGPVDWTAPGPTPNVAKTKLCGGQWRKGATPTGYDLIIVDNSGNPDVPTGGTIEPITA